MYADVLGARVADLQKRLRQAAARASARASAGPSATNVNPNSAIAPQSPQQSENRGRHPANSATSLALSTLQGASRNPYIPDNIRATQAAAGRQKRYLLLCINTGGIKTRRVHLENIDLTTTTNDEGLFERIREAYEATRNSTKGYFFPAPKLFSRLFGGLSLTIPGGANFVRVSQHNPTSAVIRNSILTSARSVLVSACSDEDVYSCCFVWLSGTSTRRRGPEEENLPL